MNTPFDLNTGSLTGYPLTDPLTGPTHRLRAQIGGEEPIYEELRRELGVPGMLIGPGDVVLGQVLSDELTVASPATQDAPVGTSARVHGPASRKTPRKVRGTA